MLTNLRGESDQIDDLLGVVDDGRLGAIERCSGGPASANCLLLRFGCSGDYKCYSDNTCACYTCNGGSCGIN